MIIPVRCFTCGKVIAGKWKRYVELCEEQDSTHDKVEKKSKTMEYFDTGHKGEILDKIGVYKMCCRRHVLTHVDLVDMI